MATVTIDQRTFDGTVSQDGIVLVDCWADGCRPCQLFAPIYDAAAARYPQHTFAKLDTETNKTIVESLGISHIPTLLVYRDGILLTKRPGTVNEAVLNDIVAQTETLDMARIKAWIATGQAKESKGGGSSRGAANRAGEPPTS